MRYSVAVVIEVGSAVRCRADADLAVAVEIKGERVDDIDRVKAEELRPKIFGLLESFTQIV